MEICERHAPRADAPRVLWLAAPPARRRPGGSDYATASEAIAPAWRSAATRRTYVELTMLNASK